MRLFAPEHSACSGCCVIRQLPERSTCPQASPEAGAAAKAAKSSACATASAAQLLTLHLHAAAVQWDDWTEDEKLAALSRVLFPRGCETVANAEELLDCADNKPRQLQLGAAALQPQTSKRRRSTASDCEVIADYHGISVKRHTEGSLTDTPPTPPPQGSQTSVDPGYNRSASPSSCTQRRTAMVHGHGVGRGNILDLSSGVWGSMYGRELQRTGGEYSKLPAAAARHEHVAVCAHSCCNIQAFFGS